MCKRYAHKQTHTPTPTYYVSTCLHTPTPTYYVSTCLHTPTHRSLTCPSSPGVKWTVAAPGRGIAIDGGPGLTAGGPGLTAGGPLTADGMVRREGAGGTEGADGVTMDGVTIVMTGDVCNLSSSGCVGCIWSVVRACVRACVRVDGTCGGMWSWHQLDSNRRRCQRLHRSGPRLCASDCASALLSKRSKALNLTDPW